MSLDLNLSNEEIKDKINAYKTVSDVYQNNKLRKKVSKTGDNLSEFRDETKTNLSELKEDSQEKINRVKEDVKNQYEELIDFFKTSVQERRDSFNENETVRKVKDLKDSNTVDFLIRQILGAANNTKSRITDIVVDEIIKTAGCSEEQTFEPNETGGNRDNKIHIKVKQIDLFKILDKNPSEGFNSLLYEKESRNNGIYPYPMNKELFSRLQLEGSSFYDEFNEDYVGDSGNGIMDIKYVTSYTEDGITYNGDFLEVTLTSRPTVNSISDFLRDYYKSIDILEFDTLGTKIINSLTNVVDLSINVTSSEKTEQNKFEKIIQRVLGLCFDGRKEIDVSGNAKTPVLDNIDDSFFEMTPVDLRIIENEVNNYLDGVTEFKDCGNVKLPVNVDLTCQKLQDLREVEESKKIDALINIIESLPEQDNWKLFLPDGINVDLSIKNGLLKIIPRSVITSILSPKTLLGLMIALKSVGSVRIDLIEDFKTFSENLKEFMVELISKIGAIFIEELFKLLKKNLRKLVEILMLEIIKETKNSKLKIITSIIFILLQLANAALDWRECKSVVDEIINLLSLIITLAGSNNSIPSFALASSGILGGYSTTRAFAGVVEKYQKAGLPTGPLPNGAPNVYLPAIKDMMDAMHDERLANEKTEIFIPPLAVVALGGGTTLPGRGIGKSF